MEKRHTGRRGNWLEIHKENTEDWKKINYRITTQTGNHEKRFSGALKRGANDQLVLTV